MTDYRRFYHPGATWLFTVNLANRLEKRLLVDRISDWPHSSFHQFVERGIYTRSWCGEGIDLTSEMTGE